MVGLPYPVHLATGALETLPDVSDKLTTLAAQEEAANAAAESGDAPGGANSR